MDIRIETKREFLSVERWLEQIGNIGSAMVWGMAAWAALSTIMIGASVVLLIVVTPEIQDYHQFRDMVTMIAKTFAIISVGLVLLVGLPKRFRNVFRDAAAYRVSRYEDVKREFNSQVDITESLLVAHGLITQDQVAYRKLQANERAIRYFCGSNGDKREAAEEYVRKTYRQLNTLYPSQIENELG